MSDFSLPIYFDYNATTPCLPEVVQKMLPYFSEKFGNPASKAHQQGRAIIRDIETAVRHIADLIGVGPEEIVITSGATESINLAIKGIFEAYKSKGKHIITTKTEHKAVLDTCYFIEQRGGEVTYLDVDVHGIIDTGQLESAIRPDTILVAVIWANNETGVIQPVSEISEICRLNDVLFFSDATQAISRIPVFPKENNIPLIAFSGHKYYGPKGIGALYVSGNQPRIMLQPQIHGGGHQNGLRSGTLNVPSIIGLGEASRISRENSVKVYEEIKILRDYFETELKESLSEININGEGSRRLPNTSSICFRGINAEELMIHLSSKVSVSTGSACSSASLEPSHVLKAMGFSDAMAKSAVRFSFGRNTSKEEVEFLLKFVSEQVEKLRKESISWQMFLDGIDIDDL